MSLKRVGRKRENEKKRGKENRKLAVMVDIICVLMELLPLTFHRFMLTSWLFTKVTLKIVMWHLLHLLWKIICEHCPLFHSILISYLKNHRYFSVLSSALYNRILNSCRLIRKVIHNNFLNIFFAVELWACLNIICRVWHKKCPLFITKS